MDELFAELKECTCIMQGREALAQEIIAKHITKLFLAGQAAPIQTPEPEPPAPEPTSPVVVPEPLPTPNPIIS